jgi:hypothetical protein
MNLSLTQLGFNRLLFSTYTVGNLPMILRQRREDLVPHTEDGRTFFFSSCRQHNAFAMAICNHMIS